MRQIKEGQLFFREKRENELEGCKEEGAERPRATVDVTIAL
jgi:hypothetical protein